MSFLWKLLQYYRMDSNISTKALFSKEKLWYLPECQSTNDVLQNLIRESETELPEGFLVRTDFQTAGRGQKGNTWSSERGENLLFSFVLQPRFLAPRHSFWLSAAMALGIVRALESLHGDVKVKWPNDVLAGGKKIAGLLIENTITGQVLEQSVVGIGLNVNQIFLQHERSTSLRMLTGSQADTDSVLEMVLHAITQVYRELQTAGREKIKSLYYRSLFKMGQPCGFLLPGGESFRGIIKGIGEDGLLVLLTARGEESFGFKEVILDY
jgi:BirA family biotin operon repressor/biotin-[acetyl-CoA-carboxylase] ligase